MTSQICMSAEPVDGFAKDFPAETKLLLQWCWDIDCNSNSPESQTQGIFFPYMGVPVLIKLFEKVSNWHHNRLTLKWSFYVLCIYHKVNEVKTAVTMQSTFLGGNVRPRWPLCWNQNSFHSDQPKSFHRGVSVTQSWAAWQEEIRNITW